MNRHLPCLVRHVIQIAGRVRIVEVDGRWCDLINHGHDRKHRLNRWVAECWLFASRTVAPFMGGVASVTMDPMDLVALPIVGAAAAGVFPALVLLTPKWIGERQTGRAVGYQLAASSLGVIATAALLAALVSSVDLGIVAPTLFVLSLAMMAANLVTQRAAAA